MNYIKELRKLVGSRPLIMAGASVFVIDPDGRILMQRRKDNGCWGLPGGAMEMGESLEDTAQRELVEETGLQAHNLQLFNVFSGKALYYKYPHGDEVYNVVTNFICRDYSGELQAEAGEVTDLQFFSPFDLPANISPPDQPIIDEFSKVVY